MTKIAALLRGINVGGKRKVAMPVLREGLEAAGCTGVRTLLNSGNVILDDTLGNEAATAARLEKTIADVFSLHVPVVIRTAAELATVVDNDPFAHQRIEGSHHLVTFLAQPPDPARVAAVDPASYTPEAFIVIGRELHLWLPNGAGRSSLGALRWDTILDVTGTARNWNTVLKLRELTAS